jgi:hypothetical protein
MSFLSDLLKNGSLSHSWFFFSLFQAFVRIWDQEEEQNTMAASPSSLGSTVTIRTGDILRVLNLWWYFLWQLVYEASLCEAITTCLWWPLSKGTVLCSARPFNSVQRELISTHSHRYDWNFTNVWEILLESLPSTPSPPNLAAEGPFHDEFCWMPQCNGCAQVKSTLALGILVYNLFNYAQSLKHLHDVLKYSWPFLFNFICPLVFGGSPTKHFRKFNSAPTTINTGPSTSGRPGSAFSLPVLLKDQTLQRRKQQTLTFMNGWKQTLYFEESVELCNVYLFATQHT